MKITAGMIRGCENGCFPEIRSDVSDNKMINQGKIKANFISNWSPCFISTWSQQFELEMNSKILISLLMIGHILPLKNKTLQNTTQCITIDYYFPHRLMSWFCGEAHRNCHCTHSKFEAMSLLPTAAAHYMVSQKHSQMFDRPQRHGSVQNSAGREDPQCFHSHF